MVKSSKRGIHAHFERAPLIWKVDLALSRTCALPAPFHILHQGCTSCPACQPGCEKMERELENEEEMERE